MHIDEARYNKEADHTLDVMCEVLERMIEDADIEDADIELSQGVLTLSLGSLGTYVINKQTPNRQIWMSSPLRYVYTSCAENDSDDLW
jgi:frataxin